MICPSCGADNRADGRFPFRCGSALRATVLLERVTAAERSTGALAVARDQAG